MKNGKINIIQIFKTIEQHATNKALQSYLQCGENVSMSATTAQQEALQYRTQIINLYTTQEALTHHQWNGYFSVIWIQNII